MPIIVPDPDKAEDTARRLLAATDNPNDVETDTQGDRTAFRVSDELAAAAGFDVTDDEKDEAAENGEAEPEPATGTDDGNPPDADEPPRAGAGSGEDAWRKFLTDQKDAGNLDADIPDDATRNQLIELWDNR